MAQFDLKDAEVYVEDGYGGGGTVDNAAGYAAEIDTMTVAGFGKVLAVGDRLQIDGHETIYIITETTETGDPEETTSITFTPGLEDDVIDEQPITLLPHRLEAVLGEGNLTFDERRNMEYKRNRGRLNTVRKGDEEPMDVRMDLEWDFLRSTQDEPPTIKEALNRTGNASHWVSTSADPCEPYAVNILIDYQPDCLDVDKEITILEDFRWEQISHDASAGTLSCTGKCNREVANSIRVPTAATIMAARKLESPKTKEEVMEAKAKAGTFVS